MRASISEQLAQVNKELWLLLSVFVLAFILDHLMASDHMVLGLYTLPTLFSAYFFGRRHATLTAFGSVLVVILVAYINPLLLNKKTAFFPESERWYELVGWGGILVVTAYVSITKVYPPPRHQGNSPILGDIIISSLSGFVGFGWENFSQPVSSLEV